MFAAFAWCQETLEDETSVSNIDERKEKRGISLNLGGGGLEGYNYLGPARGFSNRGYTPITEYGKVVKWKLMFAFFAPTKAAKC